MTNMDSLSKCIKLAVENGYPKDKTLNGDMRGVFMPLRPFGVNTAIKMYHSWLLLDPAFFQALGRGLGWGVVCPMRFEKEYFYCHTPYSGECWRCNHHRLIDWIDDGKSVEEFMRLLLTK